VVLLIFYLSFKVALSRYRVPLGALACYPANLDRHPVPELVGSRAGITQRPSLLDPDVRVSPHPAPDNLGRSPAHVNEIVTRLMHRQEVVMPPVVVVAINVVEMNGFSIHKGELAPSTDMTLLL
jgi:hypothetical protein